MSNKLVEVLNENVLRDIIRDDKPVEEVVENLYQKGFELFNAVDHRKYESWEDFKNQHSNDITELSELEGASDFNQDDVLILRDCPMFDEVKKLYTDGKPPECHSKIVEDYMEQNPGSNAILHPGCIAHQVARQLIVKNLSIKGIDDINFTQLACRSMGTGKIVYDENGLASFGMTKEKADQMVEGYACLYAMVKIVNKEKNKKTEYEAVGERN